MSQTPDLLPIEASFLPDDANGQKALPFRLGGSQSKTAYALRLNAEKLVNGEGRGHFATGPDGKKFWKVNAPEFLSSTGFLTLTVGDYMCYHHGRQIPVQGKTDMRLLFCPRCGSLMHFHNERTAAEANRRFNNLNRKFLKQIFARAIVVTERHQSGGIHYHLLGRIASGADIRTGVKFSQIDRRDYRSAPEALRALWALLRATLPKYGFGRNELLPVRKTSEAVAAYISKYIEKNICHRLKEDKGKKLVRYIGWEGTQLRPNDFAWATPRAVAWRGKARDLAAEIHIHQIEQCAEALGPRWAMHLTSTWQSRTPDDLMPYLVCDAWTRHRLMQDIANISVKRRPGWLRSQDAPPEPFLESEDASELWGRKMPDVFRVTPERGPDFDVREATVHDADGRPIGLFEVLWEEYQSGERERLRRIAESQQPMEYVQPDLN